MERNAPFSRKPRSPRDWGVDHLVYAVPDLGQAMDQAEAYLGIRPIVGGRHPQWGTWNALLSLGDGVYLEWVAAEPGAEEPGGLSATVFGVDRVREAQLVSWCARVEDLEGVVGRAQVHGLEIGSVLKGGRDRPDGTRVEWRVTDPRLDRAGGLLPFLIDWGSSPHPSEDLPGGAQDGLWLSGFWIEHPEPEDLRRRLQILKVEVEVRAARAPALVAQLSTPRGPVVHRSDRPIFSFLSA